jgi:transposase-like protein
VFGLVERRGKYSKVINYVVPNTTTESLIPLINKTIKKGSIMVSDDLGMYRGVVKDGYHHYSVKHKDHEYVNGIAHTAAIDGYWSLLKRGIIGIYHNVSPKHLHRYCDEFAYRYNTRSKKDVERFNEVFANAEGKRLRYPDLIKKG